MNTNSPFPTCIYRSWVSSEATAAEEIKAAYGIIYFMADSFDEVHRKLEDIVSKLKSATDPTERRTLLREMSRLLAEAQRISFKPPK
jgi:hypothetical protein